MYHDMGVVVDALTDQQAGQLLKAILAHVRMEYYEIEDPVVQIAFLPIRQTLERDHEKYLGIVDRNRANGSKGGRPRKNPVGYLGTQENPKEPKKADRDIGKDIDTDKQLLKHVSINCCSLMVKNGTILYFWSKGSFRQEVIFSIFTFIIWKIQ